MTYWDIAEREDFEEEIGRTVNESDWIEIVSYAWDNTSWMVREAIFDSLKEAASQLDL